LETLFTESGLKIVVTNDDGYDQPGLFALADAVRPLGAVTIVAPATPQSNVGHRVTMKTPIQVDRLDSTTYVVHATPADCTRLAIKQLVNGVDWIIAGINPGANLGSDVYQSGTVAAAREAAILGIRAMAVSQYIAPDWTIDWSAAKNQAARLIPEMLTAPLAAGQFWNINLPSPITPDAALTHHDCPLDKHPHQYRYIADGSVYRYEGIIHNRPRSVGSDVDICFRGMISITRLEI
jgi:5'-nucleotidase